MLYYIPLRYLVLAFVINKFTKRFRKPKDYVDNNELADFLSRLPSDPELVSNSILQKTIQNLFLFFSYNIGNSKFLLAFQHRKRINVQQQMANDQK
jgi:hypothetical protein